MNEPEILDLLASRNQFLSRFHFEDQAEQPADFCPELTGKKVTIINFRDDFSLTLARLARTLGCAVDVVDYTDRVIDFTGQPLADDIVIL